MAIKISGTDVIDNNRNLVNINRVWTTVSTTSSDKTLVNRELVHVTNSGRTITLPASPQAGWEVQISVGTFSDTTVARNGSNIMDLAENLIIDQADISLTLLYVDATRGWRIS